MRKLLQLLIFLVFSFSILAQTEKPNPVLADEFGSLNSESLSVRVEFLRTELQNNPNAKGYIVIYRDKTQPIGFPIRYGVKIKGYLTNHLGVSPEKFEIINGGTDDKQRTQIWISTDGVRPAIVNPQNEKDESNKSWLFDDFFYPGKYDGDGCCAIDGFTEEEKKASLEKFAQQLKNQPSSKGYIILYGQNCTDCSQSAVYSKSGEYEGVKSDIYLDSPKEIKKVLRKEKKYLQKNFDIDDSRIITINGGYKEFRKIELWIMPKGGEIPKPKNDWLKKMYAKPLFVEFQRAAFLI